jgi:hypothetical protein
MAFNNLEEKDVPGFSGSQGLDFGPFTKTGTLAPAATKDVAINGVTREVFVYNATDITTQTELSVGFTAAGAAGNPDPTGGEGNYIPIGSGATYESDVRCNHVYLENTGANTLTYCVHAVLFGTSGAGEYPTLTRTNYGEGI